MMHVKSSFLRILAAEFVIIILVMSIYDENIFYVYLTAKCKLYMYN